jgi:hypothetical protein
MGSALRLVASAFVLRYELHRVESAVIRARVQPIGKSSVEAESYRSGITPRYDQIRGVNSVDESMSVRKILALILM